MARAWSMILGGTLAVLSACGGDTTYIIVQGGPDGVDVAADGAGDSGEVAGQDVPGEDQGPADAGADAVGPDATPDGDAAGPDATPDGLADGGSDAADTSAPDACDGAGCSDASVCPSGPTAVIEVAEGATVAPRTTLHLTGAGSLAGAAPIVNYVWTVQQPGGSVSKLKAGEALADQTFVTNVVGAYVFSLSVTDADGVASCALATTAVEVVPLAALHIEVLWDTPGDPDPSDQGPEAGSDVDVHFAHPFAKGDDIDGDEVPDGWFDSAFDCYWLNAHPNWGSLDPEADDDPSLDREDTDGAGPEIISLPSSAPGLVYRVGVHLWNAHGKGPSTATVRAYFQAALVGQWAAVLNHQDFWEVATIEGATGAVSPFVQAGGGPKIVEDVVPALFAP
jgi:hypothetical protein